MCSVWNSRCATPYRVPLGRNRNRHASLRAYRRSMPASRAAIFLRGDLSHADDKGKTTHASNRCKRDANHSKKSLPTAEPTLACRTSKSLTNHNTGRKRNQRCTKEHNSAEQDPNSVSYSQVDVDARHLPAHPKDALVQELQTPTTPFGSPIVPIAFNSCRTRWAACRAARFHGGDRFQRNHPSSLPKLLCVLGKKNHHGVVKKQGGDVHYSSIIPGDKSLRFEEGRERVTGGSNGCHANLMEVHVYPPVSARFFRHLLRSVLSLMERGEGASRALDRGTQMSAILLRLDTQRGRKSTQLVECITSPRGIKSCPRNKSQV